MRSATLLVAGVLCAVMQSGCGGATTSTSQTTGQAAVKLSPPTFAQTVNLRPVSGTVLIELPATTQFVPLSGPRQVAVGTVIDTRTGVVRLTASYPKPKQLAVAHFQDGVFQVQQARANAGLVDLRIQNVKSAVSTCGGGPRATVSRRLSARELGLLLGSGTGRFRTDGEFSAATVRGTKWGVRNRCDGTLTIVRSGTVVVTDFVTHKTIVLHTGQQFLATAP